MISPLLLSGTLESSKAEGPTDHHSHDACSASARDAGLVGRFISGDEDAFAEIVGHYRLMMFNIALSHLRNQADAEEIAQDTFIHAYRGLARFRGDSSLSTWLYRIVCNLSRNRRSYYYRRHRQDCYSFDCVVSGDGDATYADCIASDIPDPVLEQTKREFVVQVAACMGKLPPRQREILTLRNLMDHSYEEIAGILGISTGTVKSRIARARENLRGLLVQTYGEFAQSPSISSPWFDRIRPAGRLQLA